MRYLPNSKPGAVRPIRSGPTIIQPDSQPTESAGACALNPAWSDAVRLPCRRRIRRAGGYHRIYMAPSRSRSSSIGRSIITSTPSSCATPVSNGVTLPLRLPSINSSERRSSIQHPHRPYSKGSGFRVRRAISTTSRRPGSVSDATSDSSLYPTPSTRRAPSAYSGETGIPKWPAPATMVRPAPEWRRSSACPPGAPDATHFAGSFDPTDLCGALTHASTTTAAWWPKNRSILSIPCGANLRRRLLCRAPRALAIHMCFPLNSASPGRSTSTSSRCIPTMR